MIFFRKPEGTLSTFLCQKMRDSQNGKKNKELTFSRIVQLVYEVLKRFFFNCRYSQFHSEFGLQFERF